MNKGGMAMPYQDLRTFLTALKDAGEHVDIARPAVLKYDAAEALAKTSSVRASCVIDPIIMRSPSCIK